MKQYTTLTRQTCIRVISCTLILLFAAHAFCFFNLTYSSPSVMFSAANDSAAQTSGGAWLQPFYWRIRGGAAAPLLVGMISAICITLTALLAADLLHLSGLLPLLMLCGAMTANSAVTSVFAAQLHVADALFLAPLLGVSGLFLARRFRFGFLPAAAFFAGSLGFSPAAFSYTVSFALIMAITDLIQEENCKAFFLRSAKTALALAAGAILYAGGYLVLLARRGYEAEAVLHLPEGGIAAAWLSPLRTLLAPLTAYTHANVLLRILLAALCLVSLFLLLRRLSTIRRLLIAALVLLLPLCVNLPVFGREAAGQYPLSFTLLDVFAAALIGAASRIIPKKRYFMPAAACAFSILFLGATVFSNQVYLKKNLEMHSTLSVMTRVIDRIEHTEGFRPGYTPVAVIGTPEDSALSIPHQGFEHLSALDAASGNYAIASYEDMIRYAYQILGYPLGFVSVYEQTLLSEHEDVIAMPAFPASGCVRYVDGTLIVKLSN